ncbi:MAG: hypothetical protein KGL43_16935 [Burkholderiales bacterium]|nr:hypothetical protein [Burkholderiales bacterium]
MTTAAEMLAIERVAALEPPLSAVEQRLAALGQALERYDCAAIESEAAALHRALAAAIDHFTRAARQGGVPSALRHRLALAGGQVAAQREALARATAALDRAIDVLLPGLSTPIYASGGGSDRNGRTGSALA